MRLAADDARFGIPAGRLGLGYHYDGMEKLMKLIGPAYTKEIFFTPGPTLAPRMPCVWGSSIKSSPRLNSRILHASLRTDDGPECPLTPCARPKNVEQLLRPPEQRDLAMLKMIADCFNSQDYQEGVSVLGEAPSAIQGR